MNATLKMSKKLHYVLNNMCISKNMLENSNTRRVETHWMAIIVIFCLHKSDLVLTQKRSC